MRTIHILGLAVDLALTSYDWHSWTSAPTTRLVQTFSVSLVRLRHYHLGYRLYSKEFGEQIRKTVTVFHSGYPFIPFIKNHVAEW